MKLWQFHSKNKLTFLFWNLKNYSEFQLQEENKIGFFFLRREIREVWFCQVYTHTHTHTSNHSGVVQEAYIAQWRTASTPGGIKTWNVFFPQLFSSTLLNLSFPLVSSHVEHYDCSNHLFSVQTILKLSSQTPTLHPPFSIDSTCGSRASERCRNEWNLLSHALPSTLVNFILWES